MPSLYRGATVLLAFSLTTSAALLSGQPERTPPEFYPSRMAPLLTPLQDALSLREDAAATPGHNASVLLTETIHFEDSDGTWYRLHHDVYYAHNESAQSLIGSRTYTYDKERESLFLITARTIRADGTIQEIDDQGIFLQAPQFAASSELYTSEEELNLVFPSAGSGSATEAIVLVRIDKPLWAGEFSTRFTFDSFWTTHHARLVVDATAATASRLQTRQATDRIVEAKRQVFAERERFSWEARKRAALSWEESAPAPEFFAPTVWLTTIRSWDEVARWFGGLIAERSSLGPDLLAQLDIWLEPDADRETIVSTLFNHVANDVRYTGLEFGLAGYQPYACDTVWANRYGDCKDKANLLRVLLAARGVTAHIALLKTSAHGRVNLQSPSWDQFNHAIVALPREDGGYDLLDPTIELAAAADHSEALADRDILIIKPDAAEWYHSPDAAEQRIETFADLKLAADGSLNGWFTLSATGISAAQYASYYNAWDATNRRLIFAGIVDDFIPGVEVIDLDYTPSTAPVRDFSIRGFIARPSGVENTDALRAIRFPISTDWLPSLATQDSRKRPYRAERRVYRHHGRLHLPPGYRSGAVPPRFVAQFDVAQLDAAWIVDSGSVTYDFNQRLLRTTLQPEEYAVLQRSIRSLHHWLEQPLTVQFDADSAALAPSPSTPDSPLSLDDFPILSTGAGQLELLETLYPEGHDDTRRRAALRQTLQWFPDDAETVFTASVQLLLLDAGENWTAEQADQVGALIDRHGDRIAQATRGWGRFVHAQAQWNASQDPAAIAELQRLAADTSMDEYRRGWSACVAGLYLAESDPDAALSYLMDWADFPCDAQSELNAEICSLLLSSDRPDLVPAWLDRLRSTQTLDFQTIVATALLRAVIQSDASELPAVERFNSTLREALTAEEVEQSEAPLQIATALDALDQVVSLRSGWQRVHTLVDALLEKPPLDWIDAGLPDAWASPVDIYRFLISTEAQHTPQKLINAGFSQLKHHRDNTVATAAALHRMMRTLGDNLPGNEALVDPLGEIILEAPVAFHNEVINARNQYALALNALGRVAEARDVTVQQFALPGITPYQSAEAHGRIIEYNRFLDDPAELLAHAEALVPLARQHPYTGDFLSSAIRYQVINRQLDEAERFAAVAMEGAPDEWPTSSNWKWFYNSLRLVSKTDGGLHGFWQASDTWWPAWERYLEATGAGAHSILAPLSERWSRVLERVHAALDRGDRAAFATEFNDTLRSFRTAPAYFNLVDELITLARDKPFPGYEEFASVMADVLSHYPLVAGPSDDRMRFRLGLLLLDAQHHDDFIAWARDIAATLPASNNIRNRAARLWFENARGEEEEDEAIANQLALLDDPSVTDRTTTYYGLRLIYERREDLPKQINLVTLELDDPHADQSDEHQEYLRGTLLRLEAANITDEQFTASFTEWMRKHDLEWLQWMPPASLADPMVPAPGQDGVYSDNSLNDAEQVRYNALIVTDPKQPIQVRSNALAALATQLVTYRDPSELAWLTDLLDQPIWHPTAKARLINGSAFHLAYQGRSDHLPSLAERMPETLREYPYWVSMRTSLDHFDVLRSDDPEAWVSTVRAVFQRPLEYSDTDLLRNLLERLVLSGEDNLVDALVEESATSRGGTTARSSGPALRIDLMRAVRDMRKLRPFWHAVRDELATHYPSTEADRANCFRFGRGNEDAWMDESTRARAISYQFSHQLLPIGGAAQALRKLTALYTLSPLIHQAFPNLFVRVLQLDCSDQESARLLGIFAHRPDADRAEIRDRLAAAARAYLAQPNERSRQGTRRELVEWLCRTAVRNSQEEFPEELFGKLATETLSDTQLRQQKINFFTARARWDELAPVIEATDPETLAAPRNICCAQHYWAATDRTDELDLYLPLVRKHDNERTMGMWLSPQAGGLLSDVYVSELIGLTQTWDSRLLQRVRSAMLTPFHRRYVELADARRRRDWAAVRACADDLLSMNDEYYDIHFSRGEALLHLGKPTAAIPDLAIASERLLDYCRRLEALALLKQARSRVAENQ